MENTRWDPPFAQDDMRGRAIGQLAHRAERVAVGFVGTAEGRVHRWVTFLDALNYQS